MSIQNIKRFGVEPAPFQLALKSPQDYLSIITNVLPTAGRKCLDVALESSTAGCALWAVAVSIGNGARISEVTRIKARNVLPNGTAWTEGSKGSNGRLLFLGLNPQQAKDIMALPGNVPIFVSDYNIIWRTATKAGLGCVLPNHKHRSITHSGRYSLVKKILEGASEEVAGEVLGHKSKRSIGYYSHPERCNNKVRNK